MRMRLQPEWTLEQTGAIAYAELQEQIGSDALCEEIAYFQQVVDKAGPIEDYQLPAVLAHVRPELAGLYDRR
jgi:hypothetical protein